MTNVYDVLSERGFVEQVSDEQGLRAALEKPITYYNGYDPSASSLHVGNLFTIMALAHLQRQGHRPIVIVGGGTGMIGDPSGKTEMRQLLSVEQIEENLQAIKRQMARYIDFDEGRALILNNADWLLPLNYIDFLREIGRHFSVNRMLASEAYRARLETGLSFIEFNYQLLQAYDFLYLYKNYGCVLQTGGNDQWGNILAGVDLVRRLTGAEVYALTFPLLTTASGAKMGKTASGAVWLDAERMSPYDFYQFWINVDDADVVRFLKIYTFLPLDQIEELGRLEDAEIRKAKEVLAYEATSLTHGPEKAEQAREASRRLFSGEVAITAPPAKMSATGLVVPTVSLDEGDLDEGIVVTELFSRVGLVKSRSEARRLVQQGGAYINGVKVAEIDRLVTFNDLRGGEILLRAGKKRYRRILVG